MLGQDKGKQLSTYQKDYVIYDLETTGISSNYDEVIEISAIKVKAGEVVEEFSHLVNPGRSIPFQASQVNGITDDMVAHAPYFDEVLAEFITFIEELPLIGHNINSFDNKFIYRDCLRFFGKVPSNDFMDTLKLAKACLPQLSHHRLTDLASYYGIPTEGAHRALNDCRMNQKVYEELAKEPSKIQSEKKQSVETQSSKTVGSVTKRTTAGSATNIKMDYKSSMIHADSGKRLVSEEEAQECIDILFGDFGANGMGTKARKQTSYGGRIRRQSSREGKSKGTQEKNCPMCGSSLKKRSGRYGEFYGCTGFPNCRYTENC